MGLYLEPQSNKKDWLEAKGEFIYGGVDDPRIDYTEFEEGDNEDDNVLICNIDNGFFYASAVVYSKREYEEFKETDGRYKEWFRLDKEIAKSVCDEELWHTYTGE